MTKDNEARVKERSDAILEALAKELRRVFFAGNGDPTVDSLWDGLARHVLAEREKREGPLVEALEYGMTRLAYLGDVVAVPVMARAANAYRALDAPPEPTLREVVERVLDCDSGQRGPTWPVVLDSSVFDDLRAALAREQAKP